MITKKYNPWPFQTNQKKIKTPYSQTINQFHVKKVSPEQANSCMAVNRRYDGIYDK